MTKIGRWIFLFSALIFGAGFFPAAGHGQSVPFGNGERFQYQIRWNIFTGGKMSLSVANDVYVEGERAFHIIADTETEGIFRRLYPFRAKVESFASKTDFLPLRYHFSSWTPDETILEVVTYPRGQIKGHWVQEKYERKKKKVKEEVFPTAAYFQDPLSIIYYLRTQNLEVGEMIEVPLSIDRKDCKIMVKVLRNSKIRVMGKVWNSFVLEPGVSLAGVPFQKGTLWIWLSADSDRIPLYFSARAALGVVSATLIEMNKAPAP